VVLPGGTHAEIVLGLVPGAGSLTPAHRDGGHTQTPNIIGTDWLRRGALAERLRHVTDARAAYRAAVKLGFSLSAYLALLRLEAEVGEVADTLLCAQLVSTWHAGRATAAGLKLGPALEAIVVALGVLLQRVPLSEVQAAAAKSHEWVRQTLAEIVHA
jgi:hypothetical protein